MKNKIMQQLQFIPKKCEQLVEQGNKVEVAKAKVKRADISKKQAFVRIVNKDSYYSTPDMVYGKRLAEHKKALNELKSEQNAFNNLANQLLDMPSFKQAIDLQKQQEFNKQMQNEQDGEKIQALKNKLALETAQFILHKCKQVEPEPEEDLDLA